ncbi:alpha/beta fold hydrolase BchO [Roseomonas sp. CECT 9278]|uniref:alpha/beta fold hydrolase BchO n=1 Tax=Roseomonas sp. CECT 9278 TaxID=2845823 RepID=UPI001E3C7091|nr:alpha/beta fold hydrolase BchO [Roseomonas sp. CECT 9278]CAH0276624.1 Soluble epoxide hydrolase [Roseomonas sp. CECT 9278]
MTDRPAWPIDGRDWPNREHSRFLRAGGIDWHVQVAGQGPVVLLLHGTAAATHSWRDVLPLLAAHATVVAPDLPGHGFTGMPADPGLTLPGMARLVDALIDALGVAPVLVAGHSAGAAVALRMALDGRIAPLAVVSLNGALTPLGEEHAAFFTRAARLLVGLPFVPRLFAWRAANRAVAERLLRDTGSRIDARGVDLYARLFRRAGHLSGALRMMANWDLRPLLRDLPRLRAELLLVVGANDRTIAPAKARRIIEILPRARIATLPGLGHLAHEERPDMVADMLLRALQPEMAAP